MGETSLERCSPENTHELLSDPRGEPIEGDPFEGEELAECSVEEYVSCYDDTAICACAGPIDPSNSNWREEVRSELLDNDLHVQFFSEDSSIDDDYDKEQ